MFLEQGQRPRKKQSFVSLDWRAALCHDGGMAKVVYEVIGGWHAEDSALFIACFGITTEEAEYALEVARERAEALERRLALAPYTDKGLDEDELEALTEARQELKERRARSRG